MPDKSKKSRSRDRDDDDDDDDARPRRRRRSRDDDDDDDDDDVPLKRKGKKGGSSLPLILGGGALLVLILFCCGVGSYFAFFRGGSPLGIGNHYTITSASIQYSNGKPTLIIAYNMNAGVDNDEQYWAVVKANGRKYEGKMTMILTGSGGYGNQGVPIPLLPVAGGPFEVWIEKRSGTSTRVVSNTYSVR